MHPEIAKTLVTQHRDELVRHATSGRYTMSERHATFVPRAGRRRFPRWRISWTRTVLAPAGDADASRAGQAGRRGSSLVIIISAYRSA